MVTLKREISPGLIDIGTKLLFISAGKETPCAWTGCPPNKIEPINTPFKKRDSTDLFIFPRITCLCSTGKVEQLAHTTLFYVQSINKANGKIPKES
jgi:hypothetical protein